MPEDWIASVTTIFGESQQGLTVLPDGQLLRDAIAADPHRWLGPRHVERFGATPALLTKLLDAGERLPVHLHPDRSFAARHLDSPFGKSEAWVILSVTGEDPRVWLGFRDEIDPGQLRSWVEAQDTASLLGALQSMSVGVGDAILVPAGTPHAIGAGVFLAELQEPTDYSVLLEWSGFDLDGPSEGHLGLGFDVALDAVDRSGWSAPQLGALRRSTSGGTRLLPDDADPFFRADRLTGDAGTGLPAGFAVVIGVDGGGTLATSVAGEVPLSRGDTVVVPYAAGDLRVHGGVEAIVCRPPDPDVSR